MSYYEKEDLVECDCCYKQYDRPISPKQADGCACELVTQNGHRFVYASYGSQFDTYKYKVSNDSILMEKKEGIVLCDECIENFINKKELIKEEDFNYWDTIWQQNVGLEKFD